MKNDLITRLSERQGIYSHYQKNKIDQAVFFVSASKIQEQERIKLGYELHDNVNPTLAAAKLYMQVAAEKSTTEKKVIRLALSAILDAMDSIRNISADMVVAQENDFSLVNGIKKFVKKFIPANIFKISCRVSKNFEKCKLTKEQQICFYRILQEQMNNIIKYSKAKNMNISLAYKQNTCIMEIKDDGVGCDATLKPAGIGLMNISNRVRQLNGKTTITTSQGQGFLLRVELPID